MKSVTLAIAALALTIGAAHAESMNAQPNGTSGSKEQSPGSTGALANANKDGIATDPQGVAEQSKGNGSTKSSPGTVGAAPGADVPSSNPKH